VAVSLFMTFIVGAPAKAEPILFTQTSEFDTAYPAQIAPSHEVKGVGVSIDGANPDTLLMRVYFSSYPKQSAFISATSILRVKLFSRFSGGVSVVDPFGDYWIDAPKRPYPSDGSWIPADASSYLPGQVLPGATRANLAECNPMTRMEPVIQPSWIDFSISMYCMGLPDNFLVTAYVDSNTTNAAIIFDYRFYPAPPMQVDISKVARPRSKVTQVITINQVADVNAGTNLIPIVAKVNSNKTVTLISKTPNVCNFLNSASPNSLSTLNGGVCTIEGNVGSDKLYLAATPATMSFNIVKPKNVVTFPKINEVALNVKQLSIETSTNTGKPVLLRTLTPTICAFQNSNSAKTLSLLNAGVCSVQAYALGDATNDESEPVTNSFNIIRTKSIINVLSKVADASISSQQINVSGFYSSSIGAQVFITSKTTSVCTTVEPGRVNLVGGGVCTFGLTSNGDAFTDGANEVLVSFNVFKVKPTLTLYSISDQEVQSAVSLAYSSSNNKVPIFNSLNTSVCRFNNANAPSILTLFGEGTCAVTAVSPEDSYYLPSDVKQITFTVSKKEQELFFSEPDFVNENDKSVDIDLSTSSNLPLFLKSLTKSVCTVDRNDSTSTKILVVGPGDCEIQVNQPGDFEWLPADGLAIFTVYKVTVAPKPPKPIKPTPTPIKITGSASGTKDKSATNLNDTQKAGESATKATASPTPKVSVKPTPTPTKAAPKITITCVKGPLTKKVTGTNPKCPAGYKKK
jgi:hypothetical protein